MAACWWCKAPAEEAHNPCCSSHGNPLCCEHYGKFHFCKGACSPESHKPAPKRIQRKRTKGWRMPEGAVYVGRPSMWGNPFKVGLTLPYPWDKLGAVVRNEAHAVEVFRLYARFASGYSFLAPRELRGHDLACWCPLDQPCHADVLLELANGGTP